MNVITSVETNVKKVEDAINMLNDCISKFDKVFSKVNAFLETVPNRSDYVSDGYLCHFYTMELNEYNVVPDGLTQEYIDTLQELDGYLNEFLITNQGQSSRLCYQIKDRGYRHKVEESDSFGPLSCSVKKNEYDWRVSYG